MHKILFFKNQLISSNKILNPILIRRSKQVGLILLCISFLFLNINSLSASDEELIKVEISENSSIIISASDSGSISISDGNIKANEGKSIRLLPGTRIVGEGSQQVTVSISSKEDTKKVANELAKAKEEEMLSEVVEKREEIKQINEIPLFCRFNEIPAEEEAIGKQKIQLIGSVTNSTTTFSSPIYLLMKGQATYKLQNQDNKNHNSLYITTRSWGEIPGTIKVLRC